uniref:Uncharacterized protein n=1 Tax=Panagrolaimus sp. ES5 TaxID=591445 RepID=A0AC34GBS2_9BILA
MNEGKDQTPRVFFKDPSAVKTVDDLFSLLKSFEQAQARELREIKKDLKKFQIPSFPTEIAQKLEEVKNKVGELERSQMDMVQRVAEMADLQGKADDPGIKADTSGGKAEDKVSTSFAPARGDLLDSFTDPRFLAKQRNTVVDQLKLRGNAGQFDELIKRLQDINAEGQADVDASAGTGQDKGNPKEPLSPETVKDAEAKEDGDEDDQKSLKSDEKTPESASINVLEFNQVYPGNTEEKAMEGEVNMLESEMECYDGDPLVPLNSYFDRLKCYLMQQPFPLTAEQQLAHLVGRLKGRALFAYQALDNATRQNFAAVEAALKLKFPNTECIRAAEGE